MEWTIEDKHEESLEQPREKVLNLFVRVVVRFSLCVDRCDDACRIGVPEEKKRTFEVHSDQCKQCLR